MLSKKHDPDMPRVPLWKKMNLTVEEAAEYSGIGVSKIKKKFQVKKLSLCPMEWNKAVDQKKTIRGLSPETQYSV